MLGLIIVLGMLPASGTPIDEVTVIHIQGLLEEPLDSQCVQKAVGATPGIRKVYLHKSDRWATIFIVSFLSTPKIEGLLLSGAVLHGRQMPETQEPYSFDAMYQGDKMSQTRIDATYVLLARVAKRVVNECGARFLPGMELRCNQDSLFCQNELTKNVPARTGN